MTLDLGTSNLVAVEPGAIREDTPAGSAIQYSEYELDTSSPYAGGVAWIEGEYIPASEARISIFDTGFGHSDLTYTVAHVWHGNIFRLGDHLDRLIRGARTAILLDADNCVAEGPGFNVVIVKDGKLSSPSRNALPGITRKTVFELADTMGLEATLRDVTSHELYESDELMAVTTAGGVTPINTLDGEAIGDGTPGPLTVAIRDRFWAQMDEPSPLIEAIDY